MGKHLSPYRPKKKNKKRGKPARRKGRKENRSVYKTTIDPCHVTFNNYRKINKEIHLSKNFYIIAPDHIQQVTCCPAKTDRHGDLHLQSPLYTFESLKLIKRVLAHQKKKLDVVLRGPITDEHGNDAHLYVIR